MGWVYNINEVITQPVRALFTPLNTATLHNFTAFVTIKQEIYGAHFIVWDEFGMECQRFYLFEHFNLYGPPVSPYHINSYSFAHDLIYIGLGNSYFFVLLRDKSASFIGRFRILRKHVPTYTSSHIMSDATKVWLLGGDEYHYASHYHRTRMIHLKFVEILKI